MLGPCRAHQVLRSSDGVTCPLVTQFPSVGRFCQAGVPHTSSQAGPPLWDPQAASSEKSPASPPPFHQVLRRWKMPLWALAKWEIPAGRGKLSMGLLSASVLGSCCSPGNAPFHTSPELVWPHWLCLGWFSAWEMPLPWWGWVSVPHQLPLQGSLSRREPWAGLCQGREASAWCFSLFQALIPDSKAGGASGFRWVVKLSRP